MLSGHDANARTNRRPVALGSDQFHLDPIVVIPTVIAQQRGNLIHIVHDNVDVAIVVVIAEGASAARVPR